MSDFSWDFSHCFKYIIRTFIRDVKNLRKMRFEDIKTNNMTLTWQVNILFSFFPFIKYRRQKSLSPTCLAVNPMRNSFRTVAGFLLFRFRLLSEQKLCMFLSFSSEIKQKTWLWPEKPFKWLSTRGPRKFVVKEEDKISHSVRLKSRHINKRLRGERKQKKNSSAKLLQSHSHLPHSQCLFFEKKKTGGLFKWRCVDLMRNSCCATERWLFICKMCLCHLKKQTFSLRAQPSAGYICK